MRLIVALIAVAGLASPAFACMNDRESPQHEREFRSKYRDAAPQPGSSTDPDSYPAPAAPGRSPILAQNRDSVLLGSGVALLAGALVVTVGRRPVAGPR